MIAAYTGLPGGGKSYKAVCDILKFDPKNYYILHNIDSLVLPPGYEYRSIEEISIENGCELSDVLRYEFMKGFSAAIREKYGRHVVVVLDEADEYLQYKDEGFRMWLKMHRHIGQHVILITQDINLIHKDYRNLLHYEYRALENGFFNNPGFFLYKKQVKGVACGVAKERKRREIFASYKSFEGETEAEKKRPWVMVGAVAFLVLGVLWFLYTPSRISANMKEKQGVEDKAPKSLGKTANVPRGTSAKSVDKEYVSGYPRVAVRAVYGLRGQERVLLEDDEGVQVYAFEIGFRYLRHNSHFVQLLGPDGNPKAFPYAKRAKGADGGEKDQGV